MPSYSPSHSGKITLEVGQSVPSRTWPTLSPNECISVKGHQLYTVVNSVETTQSSHNGFDIGRTGGYMGLSGTAAAEAATTRYKLELDCRYRSVSILHPYKASFTVDVEVVAATMRFASGSLRHVELAKGQALESDAHKNRPISPPTLRNAEGDVTYAVSPALPTGLSLDTSTGVISGTPTATQSQATYSVTATDSSSPTAQTASYTVPISVIEAMAFASANVADQTFKVGDPADTVHIAAPTLQNKPGSSTFKATVNPDLPAGMRLASFSTALGGIENQVSLSKASAKTTYTVTVIQVPGPSVTYDRQRHQRASYTVSIEVLEDDRVAVAFAAGGATVAEGSSATYEANLEGGAVAPAGGLTLPITVNAGTAQTGDASSADYGTVPASITIAAGQSMGSASLSITDDNLDELRERVRFAPGTLPDGYRLSGGTFDASTSTVTVLDQDATVVSLSGGGTVTEGDTSTSTTVTVSLSRALRADPLNSPNAETLAVPLTLTESGAVRGTNYTVSCPSPLPTGVTCANLTSGTPTVTFTGSASAASSVAVTFTGGSTADSDTANGSVGVALGTLTATNMDGGAAKHATSTSATVTVSDATSLPELTVASDCDVVEGTDASFTVTANPAPAGSLSVRYSTTKLLGLVDSSNVGTFTVNLDLSGGTAKITVPTVDDTTVEHDGSVRVSLDTRPHYTLGSPSSAEVNISDNDPQLTIAPDGDVTEGSNASFTLTASGSPQAAVTVHYTVTATGGYVSSANLGNKSVTLSGASRKITVPTEGDNVEATDGSVTVTLVAASNKTDYSLGSTAAATANVADDDGTGTLPELSVLAGSAVTEGTAASFTINASQASASAVTVDYTVTQSGSFVTAANLSMKQVTLAANATSVVVSIPTEGDSIDEAVGSVTVTIDDGTGYTVSGTEGAGTVAVSDDDATTVTLSVPDRLASEGDSSATATLRLALNRALAAGESLAVPVAFAGGTVGTDLSLALSGSPTGVALSTSTVTFTGPSAASADVTVTAIDDVDGSNERVSVSIPASSSSGSPRLTQTGLSAATGNNPANPWLLIDDDDESVSDPAAVSVPSDWGLVPSGLSAGDRFRLLFISSTKRDASSADIADYNAFVQARAAAGHTDIQSYNSGFRAVASTPFVDASANTATASSDTTSAIYWLGGPKAADNYNDFWDGSWDHENTPLRDESGSQVTFLSTNRPWTGTGSNRVKHSTAHLGTVTPTGSSLQANTGTPGGDPGGPIDGGAAQRAGLDTQLTLYGLSQVFEVAASGTPLVSVTAGTSPVTEGTAASFTLTASPAPTTAITVSYTVTQSGSYVTSGGTGSKSVSIGTSGTATVTVPTQDDSTDETNGSVTITINTGADYAPGSSSTATVNVNDDDGGGTLPVLKMEPGSVTTEGSTAYFSVSASPSVSGTLSVSYTVTQNGAFVTSGNLGSQTADMTGAWLGLEVPTVGDSTDETSGSVTVTLNAGSGYTVDAGAASSTVLVLDDDGATELTVAADLAEVDEGSDARVFVHVRPKPTAAVDIPLTLTLGTAEAGDVGTVSTVSFAKGSLSESVTISTSEDTDEDDDTFTVGIGSPLPAGYVAGAHSTATFTITDTGTTVSGDPELSIAPGAQVTEGTAASFTVTASPVASGSLTVSYSVAQTGDYVSGTNTGSQSASLDLSSGTATITVPTIGDSTDETDGTVTVTISAGTGYTVSSTAAVATVNVNDDDDPGAEPDLTISRVTSPIVEGQDASFRITASEAPTSTLTVRYHVTQSGSYVTLANRGTKTVSLTGGSTTVTVTVSTDDDSTDEDDGSVSVTILTGTGYGIGSPQSHTVTVNDNDSGDGGGGLPPTTIEPITNTGGGGVPPPEVTLPAEDDPAPGPGGPTVPGRLVLVQTGGSTIVVSDAATTDTYTLTLAGRPSATVRVTASASGGVVLTVHGESSSTRVLTFKQDDWDEPQQVTVSAVPPPTVGGYFDVAEWDYFSEPVRWSAGADIMGVGGVCFAPNAPVTRADAAIYLWNAAGRPDAPPHSFADVRADEANAAVSWMFDAGISTGTSDSNFSPDGVLTRAELVAFLWRLAGRPSAPAHGFSDVVKPWQQDAVSWAAHIGITTGTSPVTFSPDMLLSRAHVVTFLWRYFKPVTPDLEASVTHSVSSADPGYGALPEVTIQVAVDAVDPYAAVSRAQGLFRAWDMANQPFDIPAHSFDDVDEIYDTAVSWATYRGLAAGTSDSTFSPDTLLTRAQLVTILWRLAGQPKAGVPPHSFDDVDEIYDPAVSWAAYRKITNGASPTSFNPDATLTHRQIQAFLNRYNKHTCS